VAVVCLALVGCGVLVGWVSCPCT